MTTIKGIVKGGQIALSAPLDWPDGTEVGVRPIHPNSFGNGANQETNDEPDDDPEAIARWISEFNAIPPLEMTAEEESQWQAARQAQRELERSSLERQLADLADAQ